MAGKGGNGKRSTCKFGHPWVPENIYWKTKAGSDKKYRECLACGRRRRADPKKARERKFRFDPEPVLGTEAEAKRARLVQNLHDRLTGTGYPTPLKWEREELLKQLEEVER